MGLEKAKFLGKYWAYDKTLWTSYSTYTKDSSHKNGEDWCTPCRDMDPRKMVKFSGAWILRPFWSSHFKVSQMPQKCSELDEIWTLVGQYIILKGLKFSSKYLQGWPQNHRKFDSFFEVALLLHWSGVLGLLCKLVAKLRRPKISLFSRINISASSQPILTIFCVVSPIYLYIYQLKGLFHGSLSFWDIKLFLSPLRFR